jgi:hypothetical protein
MKVPKKFLNYEYGVRFVVETHTNALMHKLNMPANDLPGALGPHGMAWIRQFDFEVKDISGRLNGGPDGLTR